jgi:hypothetical protein
LPGLEIAITGWRLFYQVDLCSLNLRMKSGSAMNPTASRYFGASPSVKSEYGRAGFMQHNASLGRYRRQRQEAERATASANADCV